MADVNPFLEFVPAAEPKPRPVEANPFLEFVAPPPVDSQQVEDDRNQRVATLQDTIDRGLKSPDDEAGINEVATITGADTATVRQAFPEFKHAAAMSKFDARKLHDNYPDLANLILENPHLVKPITADRQLSDYAKVSAQRDLFSEQHPWMVRAGKLLSLPALITNMDLFNPVLAVAGVTGQLPELPPMPTTYAKSSIASETGPSSTYHMLKDYWGRSMRQQDLGPLGIEAMVADEAAELLGTPEAKSRAYAIHAKIIDINNELGAEPYYGQNKLEQTALGALQALASQKQTIEGLGIGGLVGGAIGAAVTKSPAGFWAGARYGSSGGVFLSTVIAEGGPDYIQNLKTKDDSGKLMAPRVARVAALASSTLKGVVEMADTFLVGLASLGPIGKKLMWGATPAGSLDFAKSSFGSKLSDVAKTGAGEGLEEYVQQWIGALSQWAGSSISAGKMQPFDWAENRLQADEAAWQGLVGGLALGGGQTVLAKAAQGTMGIAGYVVDRQRSVRAAAQVQGMIDLAQGPTAKVGVKALAKMVQSQAEAAGRPVREVWANPVRVIESAQDQGITPSQLATELMGEDGPSRLQKALESWRDEDGARTPLRFTVEEVLGRVGNHLAAPMLLNDMTAAAGALTIREMKDARQADDTNTKTRTREILEEMQRDGYAPASPIEAQMVTAIEEGLKRTQKYTPEKVEATVAAARAVAETMSARMGTPHDQTFARYIVTLDEAKNKATSAPPVDAATPTQVPTTPAPAAPVHDTNSPKARLIKKIIKLNNDPVEIARDLGSPSGSLASVMADVVRQEANAKMLAPAAVSGGVDSRKASSMWNAWTSVLEASALTDELPSEKQDSQFKRFKEGKGPHPGAYPGGLFQGLDDDFPGEQPISGGFEALWRLAKGSLLWADIMPAVEQLTKVPGFEGLKMPQEVIERMAADLDFTPDEIERLGQGGTIDRGYVQIAKSALKTAFKIFVTDHADISTPLHELAHTYMEMLADIAETPGAPESFKRDFAMVLAEHGVESRAALTEAHKEAFADGFEKYLLEGKAPSIGLAGIFQSLRAWLLEIYKGVRRLNVKLSDEMRGVFDRMLATDTEIEEMQRAMGRSGPPDIRAQREVAKMQRSALAPEWRKAVEAGRVEAEAEYDRRPDFQAMRLLTKGEAVDATGAVVEAMSGKDVGRLNRKAVLKDISITSALGKKLRPRLAKKGGLSPASVAAQFGYADARAMYRALDTLPDREATVAERAQALAAQAHPELAVDQSRVTKIIGDTLHEGEPLEIVRELEKLIGGKEHTQALHDAAQQLASKQVVRRINLTNIANRERLMAEQSMMWAAKGNIDAAASAKRKQLLAHYFYHEMALLRDERDAFAELVDDLQTTRRLQVFGKAGGSYGDVTSTVLESIGAKASEAAPDRKGFADVAADLALDELAVVDLARLEKLMDGTGWREMTADDMLFIRDALGQFWTAAQDRVGVIVDGKREAINLLGTKMYGDASLGPSKGGLPMQGEKPGKGMQAERSLMQSVSASLAKPLELFRELGDTAMTVFWNGYLDARKVEDDLARDVLGYLEKHWLPDNLKDTLHEELTDLDGVPWPETSIRSGPMTRSHMMLIALNMGNESNRERLLGGYGWGAEANDPTLTDEERSAAQARPVLAWLDRNMTAKEWDFVESIWKLFDGKLRGRMVEVFKDINGIEPRLIKATPHALANGRVISGGYFPAKYDPKTSALGARVEGEASTNLYKDGRATVSKAFTKERAAHYSDVVSLDWGVVPSHVASVIHYVAFERYIRDANRVLKNEMAQKAVTLRLGVEYAPALESWLRAVASSSADAIPRELHGLHGLYGYARSAAVVSAIGFSVPVAAGDLFNPFVAWAAGNIKAKHLAVAALKTIPFATYGTTRKDALTLSPELRHRTENLNKNIRWLLDRARGESRISKIQDGAITAAFYMMEITDRIMSTVIWQAKYSEGLASGMQEDEAIRQADVTVQESLPSHDPAEMASITRDKRGMAALIMFYGWFNTILGMNRKIVDQVQVAYHEEGGLSGTLSAAGGAGRMLGIFLVANVVSELFSGRGPEPDEEVAEWLVRKMLAAPFTTLPLVGSIGEELVNQAVSGKHRPFSVRASPGASVVEKLARAITKALDDGKDVDERVLAGLEAAGVITKTPIGTAQFKKLAGYIVGEDGLAADIARGGIAGAAGVVEGIGYGPREGKAATPLSILTRE